MKQVHWMWVAIAVLSAGLIVSLSLLISGGDSEPVSGNGKTQTELNTEMAKQWGGTPIGDLFLFCDTLKYDPGTFDIALTSTWEDEVEREWAMSFYKDQCIIWGD